MDDSVLVSGQQLTPDILGKLENYEDYLSFYIQLEETSTTFSWLKADTLFQMAQKLGDTSLDQLSKDLKQKKSTVASYVRVARAYPIELREPAISFSAHFQASFADSFDDYTKSFNGNKRFDWIKKAAEENLSTRQIAEGVLSEKRNNILENGGEAAATEQEMKDKVKKMKILLDKLLKAARKGDTDAQEKIRIIHDKIYVQN